MKQKSIKDFKKLGASFRALTTKVQINNHNKTKNLKDTNLELEACKKEYQNLYLGYKNLKKKSSRRNCLNIKTITSGKQQRKLQQLLSG